MGEKVTRQQACRRLARAAIISFVRGDETLATHLCIQAAFRVCRDVVKRQSPAKDYFSLFIKPERLKEFLRSHARIANFLKHADKNESQEIDLLDINMINEHELMFLCTYYELAFGLNSDPYMRGYAIWYIKKHSASLKNDEISDQQAVAMQTITLDEAWSHLSFIAKTDRETLAELRIRQPEIDW